MSIEYFILNSTLYIFLSSPWNFFQNRSHLRHKASLNKYQKIEITPCILSAHNVMKLELNNKSSSRKICKQLGLYNTLLNHPWVIEEIREKIKNFLEFNENENTNYQTYGKQQR
jgi:hypothetical protein